MKLFDSILRNVFPHVCEICEESYAGPEESFICHKCRSNPSSIKWVEEPTCKKCGLWHEGDITTEFRCSNCSDLALDFSSARAAAKFDGLVQEVIHRYKYNRCEWFEPFLAEVLITRAASALAVQKIDLIVPIPLHPRRKHERGFNQAERLARRLAPTIGAPINTESLLRVRDTTQQAMLDRELRVSNVKGAFKFVGPRLLNQKVLLVDDVLTTGVTAGACAKELLSNGAAEVFVWTVARSKQT